MKVIIVDDSAILRERLTDLLSEIPNLRVIGEAETTTEAIAMIQDFKPDAVILDIRLTGGSGIDVLKTVKQGPNPPLVFILTHYPYPHYRKQCLTYGADYFFDKSVDMDRVVETFRNLAREKTDCCGGCVRERWEMRV